MSSSPSVHGVDFEPAAEDNARAIPQDSPHWFHEEVFGYDAQLKSHLRRIFPTVRDIEDVVQESYARIWKARAAQPIRSARAFLFKIARRLAIDYIRHNQASPIEGLVDLDSLSVIEEKASSAELATVEEEVDLLGQAIATLPARCREVLVLRKLRGLSQKEIAATLGISESTVQGQIRRAMKKIEKFLKQHGVQGSREP